MPARGHTTYLGKKPLVMTDYLPEDPKGVPHQAGMNPYTAPVGYTVSAVPPYDRPPRRGLSITSLVLGVVSMFLGWLMLLQIAGLIFGLLGLSREAEGKPLAITGVALNGLALLGWGIFVAFMIAVAIGIDSAARYGSLLLLG